MQIDAQTIDLSTCEMRDTDGGIFIAGTVALVVAVGIVYLWSQT